MIEDLQNARELLSTALDRYITACSTIVAGYDPSHTLKSISQEIADTAHNELDIIASYHTKLTHARAMVHRTMNNVSTLTPIHMLSSEILSYIFQLVRDSQPEYLDKDLRPFPATYPETLTYVCSHWRRLAKNSRTLWSHIQISDSDYTSSNHTRLLARAKAFSARSDPLPVDIYVIGGPYSHYDTGVKELCASVAARIRTFDMSAESFNESRISVLQTWMESRKPGSLNNIVLKRNTHDGVFERIEASEAPFNSTSLLLQMSHEHLEERLRPIKVLQMTGVYFHWASQAYHGLVDLRLFPMRDGVNLTITQARLKSILTASPRLRELHFGLQIIDILSNDSSVAASLNDLEVVNLCSMKWGGDHNPLLQLLAPGIKPLQLSMSCRLATSSPFLGNETMRFLSRSNVTKLHIESFDTENTGRCQPLVLPELLRHVPTLRALSLCRFYLGPDQADSGGLPPEHNPSSYVEGTELESYRYPSPQLDVVHLRDCTIDLDYIRTVIRAVPVQQLKYKGCWFHSMEDGYSSEFEDSRPQDNFPSIFSYVPSSWPLDESCPWA